VTDWSGAGPSTHIIRYRQQSGDDRSVVSRQYRVRPKECSTDVGEVLSALCLERRLVIASDLHRGGLDMGTARFNFDALAVQMSRNV
jgi:hypothetical protein